MWLEPSSHTSQKPRCMRHPGSVAVASLPPLWKLLTRRGRVVKAVPYDKQREPRLLFERVGSPRLAPFPTVGFLVFHGPTVNLKRPPIRPPKPTCNPVGGPTLYDKVCLFQTTFHLRFANFDCSVSTGAPNPRLA